MLGLNKLNDQQIIEMIQQGHEKALLIMYRQNLAMVKNFVRKNNGTDEEVPDLMQDTVIAVWQNANKPNFSLTVKLSTYIMSIAKNLWYKQLRKKSRLTKIDESHQQFAADEVKPMHSMDISVIRKMVDALDDTCRQLLSYFYFDELDNKVIAEKMGFANTDVVKSKKYQCFKKLETEVKAVYNKEDFFGN